jgi:hypothetical protein
VALRIVTSLALGATLAGGVAGSVQGAVPYGPGAVAAVVRDAKGTAIVGALVVAQGPVTRQGTTSLGGLIVFQALPLGTYDVSVTNPGFAETDSTIVVRSNPSGPQYLDLRLSATNLASAAEAAASIATKSNPADDPFVGHALAAAAGVDIVPDPRGGSSAAALLGATPLESRVELDGIPLAGNFSGADAMRFRSALALDAVDVTTGLSSAPRDTALDAIGGTINYRTPSVSGSFQGGVQAGYDSSYGSFQHAAYSQTFGPFGIMTDLVTGGGENRSQVVKAQFALSPTTSLGLASYGSQSTAIIGNENVSNVAPASAIDLRTKIGPATFEARSYQSSSATTQAILNYSLASNDRVAGTQFNFDIPAGQALVTLGYDRRSESTLTDDTALSRTYSTLTAKAGLPIARAVRLELADAYGGGSQLHRRHSPLATLTAHLGQRVTLRLSAGGAFATLPLDMLALLPATQRSALPETSFGYRGSVNVQLDGSDRIWASAFALRRFDALAALSQARSRGLELGYERSPKSAGLGALAYVTLQRAYGFGTLQPFSRLFTVPAYDEMQIPGDAYSKARVAVTYRLQNTLDLRVGSTFLGSNNAFATQGFALGDASLGISLGSLLQMRAGIENVFGHPIADPILAGEYAPHELTLSIGRR